MGTGAGKPARCRQPLQAASRHACHGRHARAAAWRAKPSRQRRSSPIGRPRRALVLSHWLRIQCGCGRAPAPGDLPALPPRPAARVAWTGGRSSPTSARRGAAQQRGQECAARADLGAAGKRVDVEDRTDHGRQPVMMGGDLDHPCRHAHAAGAQAGGDLQLGQVAARQGLAAVLRPQPAVVEQRDRRIGPASTRPASTEPPMSPVALSAWKPAVRRFP